MATRIWSSRNDIYSGSESEEELDDVADTFEEKSEQDDSLHGAKYEANKNTMTRKTMERDGQSWDFFASFRMDSRCGVVVDDADEDAILSGSEDEDGVEEQRSLRDRYLKMCEEIEVDATLDERRIIIPEKNRKYELLKRVGAIPTHIIRNFLIMIGNHISTVSAPHGVDPCFIGHMPFKAWKKSVEDMYVVLEILKGSDIVIGELRSLECYKGKTFVFGNLIDLLETIDIHLFRRLQCVDLGPQELVEVLRNEYFLYGLCQNFQQYFVSIKEYKRAAKSALIMMEILYYKNKDMYDLMREVASVEFDVQVAAIPGSSTKSLTFPEDCMDLMYDAACFISKHGDKRTKTHAMLCYIYQLAITDQYLEAVNVLCNSGLPNRSYMSVSTRIFFSRTLAQLGLCSFRAGSFEEAHALLYKFQDGEWSKLLLKQGKPGKSLPCNDADQEFLERRKQMPRHMHINLQHLELGYQLCEKILGAGSQPKEIAEVKLTGTPKDVEDYIGVLRKWDFSKFSNVVESRDFWMRSENNDNQSHQL